MHAADKNGDGKIDYSGRSSEWDRATLLMFIYVEFTQVPVSISSDSLILTKRTDLVEGGTKLN
jgi:hypothetical protein